jgi:hypothetical protein
MQIECSTADTSMYLKSIVIYERVDVAWPKRLMFLHGQVRSSAAKNKAAFPPSTVAGQPITERIPQQMDPSTGAGPLQGKRGVLR